MAELANTFPVLSLAGVANSQGYCSLSLAELVPGCGTVDIELNGGSFRADVLPDRIIITATEPYDEDIFRAEDSSVTASTLASIPSPTRIATQGGAARLPLHGVLNNILGRSYRVQPQDSDETTTDSVELSPPKGGSNNNPRPSRPDPTEETTAENVNNATDSTKVALTSICGRPGVSKLLDIDLDLSGINVDIDLYLDILSDSSSDSGGLVSRLLKGILGRRDVKEDIKAKAAEQKEKAQKLKDRLKAEAAEEEESVIRKTYEAKCGAVLAVPTTTTFASPTSTTTEAPRRPAKANTRPARPEPAREITEIVVTIEEVSEEVTVVEECIQKCEKASVRASVRAGEVRECLGVTVKREVKVDNCVYFVGGLEVVDLELVLLVEEEAGLEEEDTSRTEEEDARSDSFLPVRRGRRD